MQSKLAPEVTDSLQGRWEPIYRSQLHYLITWSTRGRRPVLKERHITAAQNLIRRVCEERGFALLECWACADHIHVLVGLRPTHSVASVIREIKGRTGASLLARFPELRVWLRGNLIWDERYGVETLSAARLDRVRDRLRALHPANEDLAEAS